MTAPSIPPARAPVRPRIQREQSTAPRLFEEEIAELLLAERRGDVCLCGGRGLGKTTALAPLAATFADDVRLRLVDGALAGTPGAELVTVRACRSRGPGEGLRFDLLPWTGEIDGMRRPGRRRVVRCGLPINISVDTREVTHDRDDEIRQVEDDDRVGRRRSQEHALHAGR